MTLKMWDGKRCRCPDVLPLFDACLKYVGENVSLYSLDSIQDLPKPVLERLVRALSAKDLNRLHQVFREHGVETDSVWREWWRLCWPTVPWKDPNTFRQERHVSPHRRFMEKLFRRWQEQYSPYIYRRCVPHFWIPPVAAFYRFTTAPLTLSDLKDIAEVVEEVYVLAQWLTLFLSNADLMHTLCGRVQHLIVNRVHEGNFDSVHEFLRVLTHKGCLDQLTWLDSNLDNSLIERLLFTCAGLEIESATAHAGPSEVDDGDNIYCLPSSDKDEELSVDSLSSGSSCLEDVDSAAASFDDLYDEAVMPIESRKQDSSGAAYRRTSPGITGLVLQASERMLVEGKNQLTKCLLTVLPHWPALCRLSLDNCIIDCQEMPNAKSVFIDMITTGRLTHLRLHHCKIVGDPHRFLIDLLSAPRKDLNLSPLKLLAIMELFILMPTEEAAEKLKFPKNSQFRGANQIDLSRNFFYSNIECVTESLLHLRMLQKLSLNACCLENTQMATILNLIERTGQLECLTIQLNSLDSVECEVALVAMVKGCPLLSHLDIGYCRLSPTLVSGDEFAEAVAQHSSLHTLLINGNRLGDAALIFYEKVLKLSAAAAGSLKPRLTSLDIRQNCIKEESLLEFSAKYRSLQTSPNEPLLENLAISGNFFKENPPKTVERAYKGLVRNLDSKYLDYSQPFAEFEAVM